MDHPARQSRGPGRRRGHVTLAVAICLVLLAAGCARSRKIPAVPPTASAPAVSTTNEAAGMTAASGVAGGVLFGGNAPLASQAARLGRKLAIVRVYYLIGQAFPGGYGTSQLLDQGSTLLVSLDSSPGGPAYSAIGAGRDDAAILSFLRQVNQAAVAHHLPAIYICFEHEPENSKHARLGSPAAFVRAWDHVHRLAEAAHLDWNDGGRLHWVWIMIHSAFQPGGGAGGYWPGAREVDIIGADGYNSYGCRVLNGAANASKGQGTPASIFNPVLDFALSHGRLPVFISEWGSDPKPKGTQPGFIRQMLSYVNANPEIAAVLYWDSPGVGCDYSINDQPASIAAMTALAHSGRLRGHLTR